MDPGVRRGDSFVIVTRCAALKFLQSPLSALAVIIPIGPNEQAWQTLLPQLNFLPTGAEICLVFCQQSPPPPELPQIAAKIIYTTAPMGRARQLNAGAAATQNSELWFVHADSSLSANTAAAITGAISSTKHLNTLHYFDLRFAKGSSSKMRINEFGVWLRTRLLGLAFGDQGFLLSRANFIRLGGYDETLPSAEDHALIWRARRAGMAIRAIGASLSTSARRYTEYGWAKTTAKHLRLTWQQMRFFAKQTEKNT